MDNNNFSGLINTNSRDYKDGIIYGETGKLRTDVVEKYKRIFGVGGGVSERENGLLARGIEWTVTGTLDKYSAFKKYAREHVPVVVAVPLVLAVSAAVAIAANSQVKTPNVRIPTTAATEAGDFNTVTENKGADFYVTGSETLSPEDIERQRAAARLNDGARILRQYGVDVINTRKVEVGGYMDLEGAEEDVMGVMEAYYAGGDAPELPNGGSFRSNARAILNRLNGKEAWSDFQAGEVIIAPSNEKFGVDEAEARAGGWEAEAAALLGGSAD
jgi:hypothetical protein